MKRSLMVGALMMAQAYPALADDETAQRFGAREEAVGMSISPDGSRIAYLRPVRGAATALFVAPLDGSGDPKPILTTTGHQDGLGRCGWATNDRLICRLSLIRKDGSLRLGQTNLVAVDVATGAMKTVTARATTSSFGGEIIDWTGSGDGSVLITRDFAPTTSTGTLFGGAPGGLGVESVDVGSLRRRTIEPPQLRTSEFISDGHGNVRIMGQAGVNNVGRLKGSTTYFYRRPGDRNWQSLSSVVSAPSGGSTGFDPYAVDAGLNVAFGFDSDGGGRAALFKVALDGSLKRELVLERPDVDVDSLLTIGRQHRVVGASFATDRREAVFFDPKLRAIATSLGRALPAGSAIEFVDASADESKMVLFVGSDVDPGRYYLFDTGTRRLGELLAVRPQLSKTPLARVQAITFKAADGTPIPAYLTLPPGGAAKNLPAIVMPHGGPSSRDEWGFDWLAQYFAAKGYAVLQPNYRGSAGYGSGWFQKNGFQSWRTAIGDVNDAGRYLVSAGIAAPGKLAIVGWSYGGYAALQSAVLDPTLYKAIVAIAPVTDLTMLREEHREFDDYNVISAFVGNGPQLVEGSPARNAQRITAPVLMFHGDFDQNVGVEESRVMVARLKAAGKSVDYREFPGLAHQLDDDGARSELLARSDAFLRKSLGL